MQGLAGDYCSLSRLLALELAGGLLAVAAVTALETLVEAKKNGHEPPVTGSRWRLPDPAPDSP